MNTDWGFVALVKPPLEIVKPPLEIWFVWFYVLTFSGRGVFIVGD